MNNSRRCGAGAAMVAAIGGQGDVERGTRHASPHRLRRNGKAMGGALNSACSFYASTTQAQRRLANG